MLSQQPTQATCYELEPQSPVLLHPFAATQIQDSAQRTLTLTVAEEVAIALSYNGISHVVLMATPQHLRELAYGFSLTEGIIQAAHDIYALHIETVAAGIEVQIELSARCFAALKAKRRQLTGRSGCGLCGIEALTQAIPDLPRISHQFTLQFRSDAAHLIAGFRALESAQPLNAQTGGYHAAALWQANCSLTVFEDVGRHNALDKLIGWRLLNGSPMGAVLLTSRLSYELVQKTALANLPLLAAISAPTALAIRLASQVGLQLAVFARQDRITWIDALNI